MSTADVHDWPKLTPAAKARLAELLRPSGGLRRIDQADVDTVLTGIREIAEVS